MEKQKLIYVESKALFSPSEVSDKAIVFIKDTKEIWTHGVYFSCSGIWATPITLSLTGDTTGSVSIDGSGNASIATTTTYLSSGTTGITDANNAANTQLRKIAYYAEINRDVSNLFPISNNANAILSLNVHDYSYTHLLGFSSNGNIYHRRRSGGTWETSWKAILNSSNYTNFPHTFASLTNKPTTLSGYGITDCIPIINGGNVTTDTDLGTLGMTTYGAKLSVSHTTNTKVPSWLVEYSNLLVFRSTSDLYSGIVTYAFGEYVTFIGGRNAETTTNNVPNWWFRIKGASGTTYDLNSFLNTVNNLDSNYLRKSGGTMTGALNFANNTWNKVGDDAYMGDCNISGMIGIKGSNATPGFAMYNNSGTLLGKLYASDTSLYWSNAKILTASGTSTLFVMGDGSLCSDTKFYDTWDKTTTSGIAWFPIAQITDFDLGTALFMVRGYAHSSIIFTVTKGYNNGNINVLAGGGSFNGSYAYIKGVRLVGTAVEIGLNASATLVLITIKVILPTFTYSLRPSLVESTSTTTPYVQYDINSGDNHDFGIISSKFTGNLIGNADTASKWKNARTITLTGDVTGSVSLDGSSNVTLTTTTSGSGTSTFLKCPDKRNSYPAEIVTSGGNIGAAFISTSTLGLSEGYYCDTLILRGYATHTAGYENALFFNKQNSSVYHSQYAFGSTTTWGTMYKFLDSNNYSSYALPLSGGTLTDTLILKAGAFTASNSNSYSGGRYQAVAKPNIRLIGDSTYGLSTIEFISLKGDTSINKPSDSGFIQFQPYGVSALSSVGSHPTLKTSGESNALVLGVTNDTDDIIVLQSPNVAGLRHTCGKVEYYLPHVTTSTTTANKPLVSTTTAHVYTLGAECLPLSGGTMTGAITLTSGSDAANAKTALSFIKSSDKSEQARIGTDTANGLGMYAKGTIYIRPNVTLGSSSTNGLIISNSSFTYNGNAVLTSSNYTDYTIPYSKVNVTNGALGAFIYNGNLLHNNNFKYLTFFPSDNSGNVSYVLIAKIDNWANTANATSSISYGINGLFIAYRGGNMANTGSYFVTNVAYVNTNYKNYKLYLSEARSYLLVPLLVIYLDEYYLAFKKDGSSTDYHFYGQVFNILPSFIYINDTSLITLVSGPSETATTGLYYYNNGNGLKKFLHEGNYSNYALPLSGGTLTGILKSTLTAGSLGTSPIVSTGNVASTAGINNTYSHLASNLTTGGALLIFLGKASSLYNGGSIGYWHKGGDGSSGNALTFSLHSANNLMVILGNGNVGINNTSPSYKLDVGGDIYSSGYVRAKSGFIRTDSSDSYVLLGGGGHKLLSDLSATHTHPWSDITSVPGLLGAMAKPIFYPYANDIKLGAYISTINNRFYSADLRYTVTTTNFMSGSVHYLFDDNYDNRMQIDKGTTATITIEGYNFIYNNGYIILYFYLYSAYPLLFPKSITAVATNLNGTTYTLNRATSIESGNTIAFSIGLEYLTKIEFTIVSLDDAYCGITNIDYFSRRTENTVRDCAVVTKYNANTLYHNLTAPKYIVSGGTSSQFLKADGSLDSTSYLPTAGGTLGDTSATHTDLQLKSSTTTLRLYSGTYNYIQSGNADFSGNVPLQITGQRGTVGSDLYLKFTHIYCRSGDYSNIDSGNYSNYALKVDGTNGTSGGVSTLLNKLTTGTATPVDADYYICQYAGGGTTTTTYHRRPMSALYTYIKSKLSLNPDERFIYATSATSNQYGTTEATGSSSTLTRTLFWRDNDRSKIGMYVQHSDNLNYGFELASSYASDADLSYRRKFNGTWGTVQTVLTSSNYNSYSPTLTGTGASGTWAISISGVAASASKVANALTIQLNGGTTAGTNKFVYDGSSAYTINITPEAIGASATSHTHSYLPLVGGTLGNSTASFTELFIKSSTANMRLMAYSDSTNYIQSGNSTFDGNATLKITGYNATTGSNLYFNFANIYCRAGDYTNIDSGNYSSYALPLSGGTMTGTINCEAIVPITDNGYSIGTSSKTLYEIHANFFKRRGSSNDYVLLGGGEHKLISDFVLNYTAVVPGGSVGNNDSWTLILNNNYSTGWYNPCTMFYIRSHNFGCGILCFYHYWDTSLTSGYYDNSVWFFGAEHSAYSGTMGGTGRDINNFLKVYIDKDNDNLKIYYNRYNNLSMEILELLFSLYLAGTLYPKGLIRASHFITNGAVTDLPTTSSTFVNIPILTAKNHTEDIKTTRSVYASAFYENSDIRLKENVHSIDLIDLLKNVDLVQFNFKDSGTKKYGVIAQLLELVGLQNLVYENNGNKAVDYISLLVLEIQRLRNEIGELKLEINKKS